MQKFGFLKERLHWLFPDVLYPLFRNAQPNRTMALFRMLQRSAFICNICFLLALGLIWYKHPVNPGIASLIIVMGFFLSVVLNAIVNFWLLFFWIFKKPFPGIPKQLIYINGGFLLIQIMLILK
jgi:hypothetical protein